MATLARNLRLDIDAPPPHFAKTKIVCTIGPKTMSVEMLGKLLEEGMSVCRLNFSHGTHEYHASVIANMRAAMKEKNKMCGIMLDTKGPEIRTGKLVNKTISLTAGQTIKVSNNNSVPGTDEMISLDYAGFVSQVAVGGYILVADGLIALQITSINKEQGWCECSVKNTAILGETKNVHLPGAIVDLPAVSDKDIEDIKFGIKQGVNFIAASFIRKAEDVHDIRKLLGDHASAIHIISKIENHEGIDNFDKILEASDGIMVARGDLGVEVEMEKIFLMQKVMITKCNAANKPVITATQMLESMIQNPRPTRAELTDVANAVLDGTDCVMLSGETASGDYPLEAVRIMKKICKEAETVETKTDYISLHAALKNATIKPISIAETVASYAVAAAIDLKADLIVTVTETGLTSRLVVKYRPPVPVVAITSLEDTVQHLSVTRGTIPVIEASLENGDEVVSRALERCWNEGIIKSGSRVVLVSGIMQGVSGKTNTMKVLTLGDSFKDIKL